MPLFFAFWLNFLVNERKGGHYCECCYVASRIHSFSCILNHMCPRERTNFTALGSDLLFAHSIVPVLGSLCCWTCAFFINCKYACSTKKCPKCLCSVHVKSPNVPAGFFFYQAKVNTKVRECHTIWLSVNRLLAKYAILRTSVFCPRKAKYAILRTRKGVITICLQLHT